MNYLKLVLLLARNPLSDAVEGAVSIVISVIILRTGSEDVAYMTLTNQAAYELSSFTSDMLTAFILEKV